MGVADNRSYKDEYLFTDDKRDVSKDYPSIDKEQKVNTVIKENPYRSNVEIEGNEIVLQPDLTALFKAVGKKHSQGGMDVLLKPESFIFSDFEGLAISKKEHELFELKEGGKGYKGTPAEVLKKNVDIKHYNTLVNILDDPYKDDLAKKSAAMMLEKYINTLGNIAYIQEEKKGLPDGVPEFSMNTAPIYNPQLKADIEANKQYMKAGGTTKNPYKMQVGGLNKQGLSRLEELRNRGRISPKEARELELLMETSNRLTRESQQAVLNPFGQQPQSQLPLPGPFNGQGKSQPTWDWQNPFNLTNPQQSNVSTDSGTGTSPITPPPQNVQTAITNSVAGNPPTWGLWQGDKLPIFQDRYGRSNAADKFDNLKDWNSVAKQLGYTGPKDNLSFQKWLYSSSPKNKEIVDKWHNQYNVGPNAGMFDSKIGIRWARAIDEMLNPRTPATLPNLPNISRGPLPIPGRTPGIQQGPEVPDVEQSPLGFKQADWQFTPWQKISQLHNLGQFANVKRYMPYRSRYNATYVDPALVNPEQAVGDIRAVGNQQLASLSTINPILRNAQASGVAGQVMNQLPGIRSQYDNQNAQILNQTRQYNNQVKNNESLVNLGFDQQYYQQAVEGRKNFDNMRNYLSNNYMNNVLRDVETNQKLAYNLLTQNNPAYGFDWRTGNFTRNQKSILDAQNPSNQQENLLELADQLRTKGYGEKLIGDIIKSKTFQSWQPPSPNLVGKKGGKVKKNPYRY